MTSDRSLSESAGSCSLHRFLFGGRSRRGRACSRIPIEHCVKVHRGWRSAKSTSAVLFILSNLAVPAFVGF